ncbi:MAG: hypothetical protein M1830_001294, partial [Pleopsidium flavum]
SASLSTKDTNSLFRAKLSPGAEIYFPSNANYTTEVTQRWSIFEAPTYYAAIKPALASDVQTIVKLAAQYNIPFLATGAGHSVTTTEKALNGVQVDLSNFNTVQLDAAANTLTVGGAVRFGDLYNVLFAAGKEIQTGSSSCVGMLGATLGGGIGRLQGLHGLILDALLSVQIVTASGDLITASKTKNADLFWAIQGAGFNFGIITSAAYQVYDATNGGYYMNADLEFPASSNATHWEILKSFDTALPPALSLTTNIGFNASTGEPTLNFNAVYAGPQAEGLAYLAPFFANNPLLTNVSMVPYSGLNRATFFGHGDSGVCQGAGAENLPLNLYGLGLKQTDPATFSAYYAQLADFYRANPPLQAIMTLIQRFGTQAVLAVPDNSTSYGNRAISTHLLFENPYNISNATLNAKVTSFMLSTRALFQTTSGFPSLTVYENYAHGDEGANAWYNTTKLPKLIGLKKLWDPKKLFSFTNPIPS